MKSSNLLLLLAVLFLSDYALAQIHDCPCDTETLEDGLTGNDIVELACPGGSLGEDGGSFIDVNTIGIFVEIAPRPDYFVTRNNVGNKFCVINSDGVSPITLQITDEEFQSCKIRLIEGCGLLSTRNIPTLSEWGFIAMAGVLGIAGLFAVRRRKAAA